ncbi:hypothetical protein YC2023_075871 [Brassica napus]
MNLKPEDVKRGLKMPLCPTAHYHYTPCATTTNTNKCHRRQLRTPPSEPHELPRHRPRTQKHHLEPKTSIRLRAPPTVLTAKGAKRKTLKTILPLEPTLLTASGLHDREEQRRNKDFCAQKRDRRDRQHTTVRKQRGRRDCDKSKSE